MSDDVKRYTWICNEGGDWGYSYPEGTPMLDDTAYEKHEMVLATDCDRLLAERDETIRRQANTIAFFASVIKSGESWTEQCDAALKETE